MLIFIIDVEVYYSTITTNFYVAVNVNLYYVILFIITCFILYYNILLP